jgi:hypothetical protein
MVRFVGRAHRPVLRLDWISCIDPGLQTTKNSADIGIAIMQKDERRTGARMFVKSGTVGNDPFVFIERQVSRIRLDCAQ